MAEREPGNGDVMGAAPDAVGLGGASSSSVGGVGGNGGSDSPSAHVVSSAEVRVLSPAHDEVHVWSRGGKAGVLTVGKGDGEEVAKRLLREVVREGGVVIDKVQARLIAVLASIGDDGALACTADVAELRDLVVVLGDESACFSKAQRELVDARRYSVTTSDGPIETCEHGTPIEWADVCPRCKASPAHNACAECPHCKPTEGAVNWVPGHIHVGFGVGWRVCVHCNGTRLLPPADRPCGAYLGDNDGTCPQLTCIRPKGHDGLHDNVNGDAAALSSSVPEEERCDAHGLTESAHCEEMERMLEQLPEQFCEGEGDLPHEGVKRLADAYEEACACSKELRRLAAEFTAEFTRAATGDAPKEDTERARSDFRRGYVRGLTDAIGLLDTDSLLTPGRNHDALKIAMRTLRGDEVNT